MYVKISNGTQRRRVTAVSLKVAVAASATARGVRLENKLENNSAKRERGDGEEGGVEKS